MVRGMAKLGQSRTPPDLGCVRLDHPSRRPLARGCGRRSGQTISAKNQGHAGMQKLTRRVIEEEEGKTSGRKERLRGHMGVRTRALKEG
jgi:hypothetical protein